jgi:quinolinate synthase
MFIWPGECHVHAGIKAEDINDKMQRFTNAEFLIHPECGCTSSTLYHMSTGEIDLNAHVLSTDGMMRHVKESNANQFVVATETGILHRMKSENPDKTFIPVKEDAVCKYMKMITLEKVVNSLIKKRYEVKVQDHIAEKARKSILRMMAVS